MTLLQTQSTGRQDRFASIGRSSVFMGDLCRVILSAGTWREARIAVPQGASESLLWVNSVVMTVGDSTLQGGLWESAPRNEIWLRHVGPTSASTAPADIIASEDYWATELPSQIAHWALSEENEEVTPQDAARGLEEVLSQAGKAGFLILYDLLGDHRRLSIAESLTLLRALAKSTNPIVSKYRDRLLRDALKHSSAAVRDGAALGIYEARARGELRALQEARDSESNPHVKRSMAELVAALS